MTRGAILIVDDNATNLFVLRAMLSKLGYEAIEAKDGQSGVDLALALQPRLVLMDLRMPQMDGMAAAAHIRSVLGDEAPAIVAVTASVTREQRDVCTAAGFAALLAKPIKFEELVDIVARFTA